MNLKTAIKIFSLIERIVRSVRDVIFTNTSASSMILVSRIRPAYKQIADKYPHFRKRYIIVLNYGT